MKRFWIPLLVLSLLANGGLVWYFLLRKPESVAKTQILINADTFDFSKTGLSDQSWALESPIPPSTPADAEKSAASAPNPGDVIDTSSSILDGASLLAPENKPSSDTPNLK
jgi:hypothetical protein